MDILKSMVLYPSPTAGNTVRLAFNNLSDGGYAVDIINPIGHVLQSQSVSSLTIAFFT